MTKDVMVTIAGFHLAEEEEDTIEMVHIGNYYELNGTHYILFEEQMEGMTAPVKNRIKINGHRMEVQKRGPVTTSMIFEEQKRQSSVYTIPYGSFLMETLTTKVEVHMEEDCLQAKAVYELSINGVRCACCDIRVRVQSRALFRFAAENTSQGEKDEKERKTEE